MGWWTNSHDVRSDRIQRIFGDVFLHASYGSDFGGARLEFEPHGLVPSFIQSVRILRPGFVNNNSDFWNESFVVTYWKPKGMRTGAFLLTSNYTAQDVEAASSMGPEPLIVSKVLDEARRIWLQRAMAEMEQRRSGGDAGSVDEPW